MSDRVTITKPKYCDFCKHPSSGTLQVVAEYDFKTKQGPWANGCYMHWVQYRAYPDLGTGKGQRLILMGLVKNEEDKE